MPRASSRAPDVTRSGTHLPNPGCVVACAFRAASAVPIVSAWFKAHELVHHPRECVRATESRCASREWLRSLVCLPSLPAHQHQVEMAMGVQAVTRPPRMVAETRARTVGPHHLHHQAQARGHPAFRPLHPPHLPAAPGRPDAVHPVLHLPAAPAVPRPAQTRVWSALRAPVARSPGRLLPAPVLRALGATAHWQEQGVRMWMSALQAPAAVWTAHPMARATTQMAASRADALPASWVMAPLRAPAA